MNIVKLVASLAVLIVSSSGFAQSVAGVDRPEIKVGDVWTIQRKDVASGRIVGTGVNKVVSSAAGEFEVEIEFSSGRKTRSGYDGELNQVSNNGQRIATPRRLYSFPLSVGKKWEYKFSGRNREDNGNLNDSTEVEVVALETVTVPAGTFEAFKIVATGSYNNSNGSTTWGGSTYRTYWYAPKAKRAVRFEYKDTGPRGVWNHFVDELTKFETPN